MAFISALTGNFKGFILFTLIILIHELGHITFAIYYKWNIEKVILLPFGALTLFNEKINRPLKEEFIILIMGPIFQIIGTIIMPNTFDYSLTILAFNLLPIMPLDGSKLVNIILNKVVSFKLSHILTLYISVLTVIFLLLKVKFDLLFMLIITFIVMKIYEEYKNKNNLFNLFLLERYTYNFNFKKRKTIKGNNLNKMKKDCKHTFYINGKYVTEKQTLKKRFDIHGKM